MGPPNTRQDGDTVVAVTDPAKSKVTTGARYSAVLPALGLVVASMVSAPTPAAAAPSSTDTSKICGLGGEAAISADFDTGAVSWTGICLTDGSVLRGDAANTNAFNRYGAVSIGDGANDQYVVTADSTRFEDGILTIEDNDITLPDDMTIVDAVVEVAFLGSWVNWRVSFYEAGTKIPAEVTFRLLGDMGWGPGHSIQSGPHSTFISSYTEYGTSAALIHVVYESDGTPVGSEWVTSSSVVYGIAMVDSSSCATVDGTYDYAVDVADALTLATVHQSVIPTYDPPCPAVSQENVDAVQGQPVDLVVDYEATGTWDLSAGADMVVDVAQLPAGLSVEITRAGEAGVMPILRLHGAPTESGTFVVPYTVSYDPLRSVDSTLRIMIAPAADAAPAELPDKAGQEIPATGFESGGGLLALAFALLGVGLMTRQWARLAARS